MFSQSTLLDLLAVSTFLILALTSPLPPTGVTLNKRLAENEPWQLTAVLLFTAAPGPNGISSFSFDFEDTNTGLELETQCERALPPGSGGSAVDPATYYPCTDPSVSFRLDEGGKLDVRRTYRDDSVGQFPYNSVTAYGHVTVLFQTSEVEEGRWDEVEEVDVEVTELVT